MMRRNFMGWLIFVWALTACTENPVDHDIRPPTTLEGEWLVAAINDEPLTTTNGQTGSWLGFFPRGRGSAMGA
jgi:hypothetical protein